MRFCRKFHRNGEPCSLDRCKKDHVIYLYQHDPYLHEEVLRLNAGAFADLYNTDEIISVPKKKKPKRRKVKE